MSGASKKNPSLEYVETVGEITRIYKSLPPRPSIEEVEAARSVVQTVNSEEQMKLEEISRQVGPQVDDVPPELFSVLKDARKTMVIFQNHEQRKEAMGLVELDNLFRKFDDIVQIAADLISGVTTTTTTTQMEKRVDFPNTDGEIRREFVVGDDDGLMKKEIETSMIGNLGAQLKSSSARVITYSSGESDNEKLSLLKVAAIIENYAKNGAKVLDLQGKLMEKMEWLPVSLGKLSHIIELNLAENRIMALPTSIGNLRALTHLDIHSNQLINLPDSFGELVNLTDLDLHANSLKSLPTSFGELINLANLDLSSNNFTQLPNSIGNLISLKRLNVETNKLAEIPFTIGSCVSLVELRLDFNELKALPEALGNLECLEVLTLHYNRIKRLPTTMGNVSNLRELDVSFNELESVPESLCFIVSLEKLNVANNFADLRALPKSIGNLEMLEELDISDDQIRTLPDSFRFLSKLRVFRADETPLEVPPRKVIKLGAQAVVEYMADLVANKDLRSQQPMEKKKTIWSRICHCFGIGR